MDKYEWYEEYPTNPLTFILNGFMCLLLGLYDLKSVSVWVGCWTPYIQPNVRMLMFGTREDLAVLSHGKDRQPFPDSSFQPSERQINDDSSYSPIQQRMQLQSLKRMKTIDLCSFMIEVKHICKFILKRKAHVHEFHELVRIKITFLIFNKYSLKFICCFFL